MRRVRWCWCCRPVPVASEHVSREVERAGSKHKPIVAFRVDAAALSAELEYFLSRSQWVDVPSLGMAGALVKLAEAVGWGSAKPVNPGSRGGGAAGRGSINQAVGTASVAKRVVVVAAVVIVLGIGGVLAVLFWQSKHGESQAPVAAAVSDKSIAVLPFTDMSQKKDQEYFADGIAEEVLDRLAQVPGLKVVGRASSFQFRGGSADPGKIGAALGVAYLLEGSVRKEANRVRVAAQLVDARTGSQRWSDHFDSDLLMCSRCRILLRPNSLARCSLPSRLGPQLDHRSSQRKPLRRICARCSPKAISPAKAVKRRSLTFSRRYLWTPPLPLPQMDWLGRMRLSVPRVGCLRGPHSSGLAKLRYSRSDWIQVAARPTSHWQRFIFSMTRTGPGRIENCNKHSPWVRDRATAPLSRLSWRPRVVSWLRLGNLASRGCDSIH